MVDEIVHHATEQVIPMATPQNADTANSHPRDPSPVSRASARRSTVRRSTVSENTTGPQRSVSHPVTCTITRNTHITRAPTARNGPITVIEMESNDN